MPDDGAVTGDQEAEAAKEAAAVKRLEAEGGEAAAVLTTLRELPRAAVVLLFGIALNRAGSFVALFLVLYLTGIGYSPARAGVVLTTFGVGYIVGAFAGGSATGRFGGRRVIVVSMLSSGAAVAAIAVVTSFVPLLAVTFAAGALGQMYRPAANTMLAELTPPGRLVMASAASRLGLNLGAAVGPLLGVWLATYSYTAVFLVNAAVAVGFGLVALVVLPDDRGVLPDGRGVAGSAADVADQDRRPRYRDLLHDRRFLLVIAGMFVTAVAEVQHQSTLPLEIQQRGLPIALYGTVVALNAAIVIAVELPLTRLIQRLPMRTTISLGCLLLGGGLGLFGVPTGVWIFFAGTVVWTMGEIISAPSIIAYPALAAPSTRLRAHYIGALSTAQVAGWAIGPALGTTLFQYWGSMVWILCAVLGVVAFLGMQAGVRRG